MVRVVGEFVRFLGVGALNTVVTYLLYLGLLAAMPYIAAYSLAYAAGIVLSYYLTARFVFRAPLRWSSAFRFPLVYVAQYLLSAAILAVLVDLLTVDPRMAPLIVIAATVPATFALARVITTRRGNPQRRV